METMNPVAAILLVAALIGFAVLGMWVSLQWLLTWHICRTDHGVIIHRDGYYCWQHTENGGAYDRD